MSESRYLQELPTRLHHSARVIRDQESNRKLVEDVLGIPLMATWIEVVPDYEHPGKQVVMCHTFYELADGSALAFFQFEKEEHYRRVAPVLKERTGMYDHAALKVSKATFDELVERVTAAGIKHIVLNHGYCLSLYVPSDQGYTIEFTCDPDKAAQIREIQKTSAHEVLKQWSSGLRESNNTWRDLSYAGH
jgi:glyoxylase I family protein